MLKGKAKKLCKENEKDFYFFKDQVKPNEETLLKLKKFIIILDSYQKKLNLIGKSTRSNIWTRHILDSAQIEKILPKENEKFVTIDVGTGAGFPGIVLAALGRKDLLLCEKSNKKIDFLNVVAKECDINFKVHNGRIENLKVTNVRAIISRAFASLKNLLLRVKHCIYSDTTLVLHKGVKYMQEIQEAESIFYFNYECYDSFSHPGGKILKIINVKEKNAKN